MPKVDNSLVPDSVKGKEHLALLMPDATAIAIPPGAVILYVRDPYLADGSVPMVLTSVSKKSWGFMCGCGKEGCTLTYTAKISHKGRHPLPDAVAHDT